MMRCLAGYLSLTLLLILGAGCTKQCFLNEADYNAALRVPKDLEYKPDIGIAPVTGLVDAPATVDHAERPPQYLTLQQAIALALENGSEAGRGGRSGQGVADDTGLVFTGGSLNGQSDRVRVLAYNIALANASLEESLSRFDAQWVSSMVWTGTDQLPTGINNLSSGTNSSFQSSIVKGLSTGGVANITFQVDNRFLNTPSPAVGPNPLYTSSLRLGVEQPLWRNFGTEINQILARFPGINGNTMPGPAANAFQGKQTALSQGVGGFNITDGILVARLKLDAQRAEFERVLNNLVLNVEVAYWKLYEAYGQLYSFEEVFRISHKVWMLSDANYKAGKFNLIEFAPIRGQYEEFRGERLRTLGAVLEAERHLRRIMGIQIEDGTRLVPVTPPTLAPVQVNWEAAVKDALALRPEMVLARENLRLNQFNLIAQKNFLKPDLRAFAQYVPTGFGSNLAGSGTFLDANNTPRTTNAFRSLATDHFNDWAMGLTYNVPIGYRLEHAAVRSAKLNLAQSYEVLKDQEERAKSFLANEYQKLSEYYRLIETSSAERKAYGEGVTAKLNEIRAGAKVPDLAFLDVNRRFALALIKEYHNITEYNNTLARFEWAKGTLLPFNNVKIAEGPLPECVQVRAVDNERERTLALVLRERPQPIHQPAQLIGDLNGEPHLLGTTPEYPSEPTPPSPPAPEKIESFPQSVPSIPPPPPGGKTATPPPSSAPPVDIEVLPSTGSGSGTPAGMSSDIIPGLLPVPPRVEKQ